LLHGGFIMTGIMTTLLGPILPALSVKWSLSDEQVGTFFLAQFLAGLGGIAVSSILVARDAFQVALVAGYLMMAIGACLLQLGTWVTGVVAVALYGLGLGMTIPTTNLFVATLNRSRPAASLNLVNLSWGIGAVACPFMILLFQRTHAENAMGWTFSAVLLAFALSFGSIAFSANMRELSDSDREFNVCFSIIKDRRVAIFGALFFLYVGTENAVGGWIGVYASRIAGIRGIGVITPALFWCALLLGRGMAPRLLRSMDEIRLSRVGIMVTVVGTAIILSARDLTVLFLGVCLAGGGLSAVYPNTIALLARRLRGSTKLVGGPMFALASLGGASLPWLVGFMATHFRNLRAGLVVPLLGTSLMFLLYYFIDRETGTAGASPDTPEVANCA
jgi:FHS family glucose/mannose:H+ symporter-like MFS transporter